MIRSAMHCCIGIPLFAACWVAGMAGCAPHDPLASEQPSRQEIPILEQHSGAYSRLARPVRVVIRDQATLAQLPVDEIDVDFEQHMILFAGLGPTWQGGSGIRIVRVWREGSTLHVEERQITGGLEERASRRRFSPWTFAVVARSDLNVKGYGARVPPGVMASE